MVLKAEQVVANAQAELGWLNILETLHVALAGGSEVGKVTEKT